MNRGQWAKYVRSYLERFVTRDTRQFDMGQQEIKQWADEARWLLEGLDGNEQEGAAPKPVETDHTPDGVEIVCTGPVLVKEDKPDPHLEDISKRDFAELKDTE